MEELVDQYYNNPQDYFEVRGDSANNSQTNDSLVTSSNVIDASSSVSDKQEDNETNNLAKSEVATEYLQTGGLKNHKKYHSSIVKCITGTDTAK